MANGASSRQILSIYRAAGIISNDEFERFASFDEHLLSTYTHPFATSENHESYYTYTKVSWDTLFNVGNVTIGSIIAALTLATGAPTAVLIIPAEALYGVWKDNLPLEGKGIEIKILWQWHYNDSEMQERWHAYYQGYEYYY